MIASRLTRLALCIATVGGGLVLVGTNESPAQATTSQTYAFTGGPQLYVVPAGVTSISVTVKGAKGETPSSGGTGGAGGAVTATISVTPGETLQVMVGGAGAAGGGGYNGGARGAGGGGGASDIRRPAFSTTTSCAFTLSCGLAERIIVAGGGGGGGWATSFSASGATGGSGGQNATPGAAANTTINSVLGDATPGSAGSSSGGSAGTGSSPAPREAAGGGVGGVGGSGGWISGATGGGGGGGWFGGGGGGASSDGLGQYTPNGTAGGGGGSSWAGGTGVSNAVFADASNNGAGEVLIDPPSAITGATFTYSGSPQFYTVPAGITEVFMRLYGAGSGAAGDIVYGTLAATPGEVLQVMIGGRGWGSSPDPGFTAWRGGYNGGGNGGAAGWEGSGGGGGATDVRRCANAGPSTHCALTDRILVSGGGGGSGHGAWGLAAGAGGAQVDGSGGDASGGVGGWGLGGTLSAGGASGGGSATSGSLGQGGVGVGAASSGGGGGGGYYGGGGGDGVGGGGGSSYASSTGRPGAVNDVATVNTISTARFRHTQAVGGSVTDGMAVITAMPQATTALPRNVSDSGVLVSGTVNPRFLASTPTVYYSTSQSDVDGGAGSTQNLVTTTGASIVAGSTTFEVSARLTGLSPGTTYFYKLCARSVAGAGCGVVRTFTTPAAGFPYFVNDTPASSIPDTGAYAYTFTVAGAPAPTMSLHAGTLPPGMTFDPVTGTLAGTPTTAGSYTFTLRASNTVGDADTPITITVTSSTPPPAPFVPATTSTTRPPSPSTTAPTPVVDRGGELPRQSPGTATVTENGREVPVVVVVENRSDLVMRSDEFELRLSGECADGCAITTTPSGRQVITLEERGAANVTGDGFSPGTKVHVWFFSEPRYLGELTVGANGSFSGRLPLGDVPFGEHTLQVNGTSADGVPRSANLGVIVERVPVTLPVTGRDETTTPLFASLLLVVGLAILVVRPRRVIGG